MQGLITRCPDSMSRVLVIVLHPLVSCTQKCLQLRQLLAERVAAQRHEQQMRLQLRARGHAAPHQAASVPAQAPLWENLQVVQQVGVVLGGLGCIGWVFW
jgi:hypothetical protein